MSVNRENPDLRPQEESESVIDVSYRRTKERGGGGGVVCFWWQAETLWIIDPSGFGRAISRGWARPKAGPTSPLSGLSGEGASPAPAHVLLI